MKANISSHSAEQAGKESAAFFSKRLNNWERAHAHARADRDGSGQPSGRIKSQPEDFVVREVIPISPAGEGEHAWIKIRKTCLNSENVARELAKIAQVPLRDVGYCGLKDFYAVTEQWFSVRLAGKPMPDWSQTTLAGLEILEVNRHTKKLQRGFHTANQFDIVVRDLVAEETPLDAQLERIQAQGVPNYFGEQRFGRQANNMCRAIEMWSQPEKKTKRHLRSLYLSAARSWLFNEIVSARVQNGSWNRIYEGERVNLNRSSSIFFADSSTQSDPRLTELDIHPTAPLYGVGNESGVNNETRQDENMAVEWLALQQSVFEGYPTLTHGLVNEGVKWAWRPTRIKVEDLQWAFDDSQLRLHFSLLPGQFATSILREIVREVTVETEREAIA